MVEIAVELSCEAVYESAMSTTMAGGDELAAPQKLVEATERCMRLTWRSKKAAARYLRVVVDG